MDESVEGTRRLGAGGWTALIVVLAWRLVLAPAGAPWTDWLAITAAYLLFLPFLRDRRLASLLTSLVVTLLLSIYLYGQFPYTLVLLGLKR